MGVNLRLYFDDHLKEVLKKELHSAAALKSGSKCLFTLVNCVFSPDFALSGRRSLSFSELSQGTGTAEKRSAVLKAGLEDAARNALPYIVPVRQIFNSSKMLNSRPDSGIPDVAALGILIVTIA